MFLSSSYRTALSLVIVAAASILLAVFSATPTYSEENFLAASKRESKLSGLADKYRKLRSGGEKDWYYGAYVDFGYLWDFNFPDADRWRSKTTTFKLNSPEINMAMGYVRKDVNPTGSRWGFEFGLQTGVDVEGLVPGPLPGRPIARDDANALSHFYRGNASYLFPIGNGLKLTAGLFNGYIGYSSFHAKDNINYTRGYILDQVPYFLFGGEALYPASKTVTLGFYIVNGYSYLHTSNDVPSFGLQVHWRAKPRLTFVQNFYYGPDQDDTDIQFWRFFSDSILEWKADDWSVAVAYDVGTEKQALNLGNPRYVWMASAIWARWHVHGPWSLGLRPELYFDPDGVITGGEQFIRAIAATVEYRIAVFRKHTGIVKLEYRFDRSTGSGGGFFTGNELSAGVPQLTSDQQLLTIGVMWAFDS